MTLSDKQELTGHLELLAKMFWHNDICPWSKLTAEQQLSACEFADKFGTLNYLYYKLNTALPAIWQTKLAANYRNSAGASLIEEHQLNSLYRSLIAAKIRFAPLKGADLAFRVYPVPALRPHVDWDILFHPQDFKLALKCLGAQGWESPYEYLTCQHHAARMRKDVFGVEPHFTLSGFGQTNPAELWQYITPAQTSEFRHILTPELNLLMLCRHIAANNYRHSSYGKLLLDIGFLLKAETVDWEKLSFMCKRWNLPYPGNILGAFPEFFPLEVQKNSQPDSGVAAVYRKIFETALYMPSYNVAEWACNESNFLRLLWWKYHLRGIMPNTIRAKYSLPAKGEYFKLFLYWLLDVSKKMKALLLYTTRRNPQMREYLNLLNLAEKSFK